MLGVYTPRKAGLLSMIGNTTTRDAHFHFASHSISEIGHAPLQIGVVTWSSVFYSQRLFRALSLPLILCLPLQQRTCLSFYADSETLHSTCHLKPHCIVVATCGSWLVPCRIVHTFTKSYSSLDAAVNGFRACGI